MPFITIKCQIFTYLMIWQDEKIYSSKLAEMFVHLPLQAERKLNTSQINCKDNGCNAGVSHWKLMKTLSYLHSSLKKLTKERKTKIYLGNLPSPLAILRISQGEEGVIWTAGSWRRADFGWWPGSITAQFPYVWQFETPPLWVLSKKSGLGKQLETEEEEWLNTALHVPLFHC